MRVLGDGTTYQKPVYNVTIGWAARASGKLLVAGGINDDGVLEGTYYFSIGALALVHWFFIRYSRARQNARNRNRKYCVSGMVVLVFPFL